jgi:hypothetical protein
MKRPAMRNMSSGSFDATLTKLFAHVNNTNIKARMTGLLFTKDVLLGASGSNWIWAL